MFTTNISTVPARDRSGLRSNILLQAGDVADCDLTVTWVDVQPGARQQPHSHDPQQIYVIVHGRGRMHVEADEREVAQGDLVFIPPRATHAIDNTGPDTLTYVSVATPAFSISDLYDAGELTQPG